MKKGFFITFEGPDGAGKTTQIELLSDYLKSQCYDVVLAREPGGTELGEKIRQIILDPGKQGMSFETEVLLYAASRAQHIKEVIMPNILAGNVVISDRFFDSSIAYQGFGRGMLEYVELVNNYITKDCTPNLTFLFKLDPQIAMKRVSSKPNKVKIETKEFYENAMKGYEYLAKKYPERVFSVDASKAIDEIAYRIIKIASQKMCQAYKTC